MDRLNRQEHDPRLRRLRELLHAAAQQPPPPPRWSEVERRVFERLDAPAAGPLQRWAEALQWLLRPPALLAAAALLVCAAGVLTFQALQRRPAGSPVARVVDVQGEVLLVRASGADTTWRRAALRDAVAGAVVRTAASASVTVQLEPGTGFSLAGGSALEVRQATVQSQRYLLAQGRVSVRLARRLPGQQLVVETPNARCVALGTVYTVACEARGDTAFTRLSVQQGSVRICARSDTTRCRSVSAPQSMLLAADSFVVDTAADSAAVPVPAVSPAVRLPDVTPVVPTPRTLPDVFAPVLPPPVAATPPAAADTVRDTPPPAGVRTPVRIRPFDTTDVAGDLLGTRFHWDRYRLRLDTLGWDRLLQASVGASDTTLRSPAGSVRLAAGRGKRYYRLRDANAVSVALLRELGYPLLVLSQWSGYVDRRRDVASETRVDRTNMLTDYVWESVERAEMAKPQGARSDYAVRLHFSRAGSCDFYGREPVELSRSQILGTSGFSLWNHDESYMPEANQYRLILEVYTVVESERSAAAVTAELERAMDKHGLDFSYKPPRLVEVR